MTFRVDAEQNTYEISLAVEFDGLLLLDTSEAVKKVEEIRSQSKGDPLSKELVDFLRGLVQNPHPEGERFKQSFNPESLRQPLPVGSAQGGVPKISGSRKLYQQVQGLVVSSANATFTWTITPYDDSKDANVTLAGCTELGVGQQGTVTAKAQPAGGTYRYSVEPSSTMAVEGQGETAKLTGGAPGQATLQVEYTVPGSNPGHSSKPVTCLRLDSFNGGQTIPKIGLFDEKGKRTEATINVPVSIQPEGAGDLLIYKPGRAY